MRIHEKGDPARPPLVLLHGLASSSRCWERTVPVLERERRLLLVDLFVGASHRFSLEKNAAELADELSARGVAAAEVLGHSMGGLVALHLAAAAPDRVSSLVLVDVPALRVPRPRLRQALAVARSSFTREASAMSLVLGCVLRTSPLCLIAATRATMHADLGTQVAAADIPTLLVWGARDGIVPLEVGERLATAMRTAELFVIPESGHQPMWETPAAFNLALMSFLARDERVSLGAPGAPPPPVPRPAG